MTGRNESQVIELTPVSVEDSDARNMIIIPIQGQDYQKELSVLGLSFDSTEEEILETLRPILREVFDTDIKSEETGWLFKTHKALDRQNIYVIPSSVAGKAT